MWHITHNWYVKVGIKQMKCKYVHDVIIKKLCNKKKKLRKSREMIKTLKLGKLLLKICFGYSKFSGKYRTDFNAWNRQGTKCRENKSVVLSLMKNTNGFRFLDRWSWFTTESPIMFWVGEIISRSSRLRMRNTRGNGKNQYCRYA